MNRSGWCFAAALAALIGGGCRTETGPTFDPRAAASGALTNLQTVSGGDVIHVDSLRPSTNLFTLGPGDEIDIEILGDPESRTRATVWPDGKVYYFVLPGVDVWGLTLNQAADRLESELSPLYTEPPEVSVILRKIESRRVWLLGRFKQPGIYPMPGPMTLLEAVSLAGGFAAAGGSTVSRELADLRHSFVIRDGERLPLDFHALIREGDLSQNVYLRPDDFVYVPSTLSREVYVLGAVASPRAIPYGERLTLLSAIAGAGGTIKNAYADEVAVVRGSLSEPKIALVDYREILQGRAADVLLEPRDVIYVPLSPYRALSKYADLIVTTFVRAVAINEGSRWVSGDDTSPVGVGITVSPAVSP